MTEWQFTEEFQRRLNECLQKMRDGDLYDELTKEEVFAVGWVNALAKHGLLNWANSDPGGITEETPP